MNNITLRNYFAALAMQGLMVTYDGNSSSIIARDAYEIADEMIKLLEKENEEI